MSKKLTAPIIANYIDYLGGISYANVNCNFTYDDESIKIIDEIFELIKEIKPINRKGLRELWFQAERGPIEDFGNFEEMLEMDEIDSYETFEEWWKSGFPDEEYWYNFRALEDKESGYRCILINRSLVIEINPFRTRDDKNDTTEFVQWILDSVKDCIQKMKDGTYNDYVKENLPSIHKTGTITYNDFWSIFPDMKEDFFKDITQDEVNEFIKCMQEQGSREDTEGRLSDMTVNDFYYACSLGYTANNYEGTDLPLEHQYFKHADGRDDDLHTIKRDSPEAFLEWYNNKDKYGHPWEVCRGGNSTNISLYPIRDKKGFYFVLSGDAWTRTIESVKFYLALRGVGIPVYMYKGKNLGERLLGTEKIGVVPEGVFPAYCHSYFPGEDIIDFMNLPYEKTEEVANKCIWQDIPEVFLI